MTACKAPALYSGLLLVATGGGAIVPARVFSAINWSGGPELDGIPEIYQQDSDHL